MTSVYFMQPVDGGPVKIGFSADVEARRKQLEQYYGVPLVLLHTVPGGRDVEGEIHGRFAHLRIGRTEQFKPGADLMAFIGLPLLVSQNPEAVEALPVVGDAARKPMILQVRGSEGYRAWLESAAKKDGLTLAAMVDRALRFYIRERLGITDDPPPR